MIAVVGATGAIGRRVVAALADRGDPMLLLGRDRRRLEAVATEFGVDPQHIRVVPAHDIDSIAAALSGASVVIAAAGPFARVGMNVATAALAAGCHYLDVTVEPGFVRALYEEHESAARKRGCCMVSGLGAWGALGEWACDWAATALPVVDGNADGGSDSESDGNIPVDEAMVAYTFDGARVTAGMARSLIAATAGPALAWRGNRWDEIATATRGQTVDFGALGVRRVRAIVTNEAVTIPRRLSVPRVDTWVAPTGAPWIDRAIGVAAPLLRWLPGAAASLEALVDPGRDPSDDTLSRMTFAVVAQVRRDDDRRRVTVVGRDLYATTAAIVVQLARGLAGALLDGAGVLTASQLIGGERALGVVPGLSITTEFE